MRIKNINDYDAFTGIIAGLVANGVTFTAYADTLEIKLEGGY